MGLNRKGRKHTVIKWKSAAALLTVLLLFGTAVYYKTTQSSPAFAGQAAEGSPAAEEGQARQVLTVAYLPITHALPLFKAKELLEQSGDVQVELVKYGGWSELMDALNTGRVDGASVLIEMAMKAREQGIPLKLALLGHRDGNVVITSNEISTPGDLAGKTFAIPNPQSSHNLLLQKLLEAGSVDPSQVTVLEMSPAEMPSALQSGQIDGYCVAEPFGAKAVEAGIGHVLTTSRELWPESICCGIVFNEDATAGKGRALTAFEEAYREAGFLLSQEEDALAAAEQDLGQNRDVSLLSLKWISFQDLAVTRQAYRELCDNMEAFGLSQNPPSYEEFVLEEQPSP